MAPSADLVEREREVHLARAGEQVGDATLAQRREVFVRHPLGEDRDDVVALDLARLPEQPAARVDDEGE